MVDQNGFERQSCSSELSANPAPRIGPEMAVRPWYMDELESLFGIRDVGSGDGGSDDERRERILNRILGWNAHPAAYGGYWVGQEGVKPQVHKERLTRERLRLHFDAFSPKHVIGIFPVAPGQSVGRWCALDFDRKVDDDHPRAADIDTRNLAFVLAIDDRLRNMGLLPLTLRSGKGYHIWVPFAHWLSSLCLYFFARWLRSFADPDLTIDCFPKQETVPDGRFGNWLRLFGRHPKREEWAVVLDGTEWVGDERVLELLDGEDNKVSPRVTWEMMALSMIWDERHSTALQDAKAAANRSGGSSRTAATTKAERPHGNETTEPYSGCSAAVPSYEDRPNATDHPVFVERARAYVQMMPPAIEGEEGDKATYSVVCVLAHGFGLTRDATFTLLHEFNKRCVPPWSELALRRKVESALAATNHRKPYGHMRAGR